jgi:hypothetical protein
MEHEHESNNDRVMKSRTNIAFIVFLIIAAFFLIAEHRAHLSGWLSSYGIWLLLLACPLMHLFMHGGHGHGGHGSSEASNESTQEKK